MCSIETPRKEYQKKCGVCNADECDAKAWHFCNQCQDYLCSSCRHDHGVLDDLKNHHVISGFIESKASAVSNYKEPNLNTASEQIQTGDHPVGHVMLDNILELNFKQKRYVNVRIPDDKDVPRISGCTFLSTGELLLCDRRNDKLKMLSYSLEVQRSLSLDGPHDVAVLNENTAVVTMPCKRKLEYINLKPTLTADKTVSFDTECWGVAASGDQIFLSCYTSLPPYRPSDIRILDIHGNETRRLGLDRRGSCLLKNPLYIAATADGVNLYVSDFEKNALRLICIDGNKGRVVFSYNDRLHGPYGMYVDLKGNVIICSRGSYESVHVVTAKGERHKALPTSDFKKPMCVGFRPTDGTLVFGISDSSSVSVFNMTPD